MQVDNNLQKLDTVDSDYLKRIDRPSVLSYSVEEIISNLKKFNGHVIIQTMFLKGVFDGQCVDNTSDKYVDKWLEAIREIAPRQVMIYTIDRETPAQGLKKASKAELDNILMRVEKLGISCSASY